MAKDKSVPLGLGLLGGNAKVYNTISEIQKDSKLKVGKVVEVLGYYQAGDGANHKRIIADSDDGSGVQLDNGLYANIVHNGEVNVSWFGAKGDGVTDDTQAIQKAIDFCAKNKYYDFTTKEIPCIKFSSKVFAITSLKLKSRIKLVGNGQNSTYLVRYGTTDTDEYMLDATGYRTSGNDHEHFLDSIGIHKMTIKGNSNLSTWDLGTNNLFSNGVKFECGTNFVMEQITLSQFKTALRIVELYDSSFNVLTVLASGNETNAGIMFGRPSTEQQIGQDGNNAIRFDNFRFEVVTLEAIVKFPFFQRENRFTNGKIENCTLKFSGNSSTSFNSVNCTLSTFVFNDKPNEITISEGFGFSFIDCVFYYNKEFAGNSFYIKPGNIINTPKFIGCTFKSMPKNCFVSESGGLMMSDCIYYDCDSPIIKSGGYTHINNCYVWQTKEDLINPTFDIGVKSKIIGLNSFYSLSLSESCRESEITNSNFSLLTEEQLSAGVYSTRQYVATNLDESSRTPGTIETIWNGDTFITNIFGGVKKVQTVTPTTELDTPAMQYAMELEGVKQDYLEYSLDKFKYDKQLEEEQQAKYKAYELLLKDNPNLTWEEFESTYSAPKPMMRARSLSVTPELKEPEIPESVQKFMEKYLGTTPKTETPKTFSFDEVDKLNDTLKKL